MSIKVILKKWFMHYGVTGSRLPSMRGCYEAPVPSELKSACSARKKAKPHTNQR